MRFHWRVALRFFTRHGTLQRKVASLEEGLAYIRQNFPRYDPTINHPVYGDVVFDPEAFNESRWLLGEWTVSGLFGLKSEYILNKGLSIEECLDLQSKLQ